MTANTIRPTNPWPMIVLLALLYGASYLDRLVTNLLVVPITAAFDLTRTEYGAIVGLNFFFIYALAGLPLAHIIDRWNRKWMVVIGAVTWSVMTLLSGLAPDAKILGLCRAGVAVGEAVLTPAAVSLIADLFPPGKRILPVAVYATVGALMNGGGAYLIGGGTVELGDMLAAHFGHDGWRFTLLLASLPGFVLALLFVATREPQRQRNDGAADHKISHYLKEHWRFYAPLLLGGGMLGAAPIGVLTWLPTILTETLDIPTGQVGYLMGTSGIAGTVAGLFLWPLVASRLRFVTSAGAVLSFAIAAFFCCFAAILTPVSQSLTTILIGFALMILCMQSAASLPALIVQNYTPANMRARMMALMLFAASAVGFTIGTFLVPWLGARLGGGAQALPNSIFVIACVTGPFSVILLTLAWRATRTMPSEEMGLPHDNAVIGQASPATPV